MPNLEVIASKSREKTGFRQLFTGIQGYGLTFSIFMCVRHVKELPFDPLFLLVASVKYCMEVVFQACRPPHPTCWVTAFEKVLHALYKARN